jgi:hypothetical protein
MTWDDVLDSWNVLIVYLKRFWEYKTKDIDTCCRR